MYASGGTYQVSLIVTDNAGGRGSTYLSVGVASPQPPVSQQLASPVSGPAPLTISFTGQQSYDPDGSVALYAWNFGDGSSSQGPQVSHTYRSPGTFQVRLTVTDTQGLTGTSVITITVSSQVTTRATTPPSITGLPTTVPFTTVPPTTPAPPFVLPSLSEPVLFLFAVLAGTGIAALSTVSSTQGISQRLEQAEASVKDYFSSAASTFLSRFEVTRRNLGPISRGEPVFLGLNPRELVVILLCAGAYALAFLLKDHLRIRWETLLILVMAGALTTLAHQLAHHEAARRAGQTAELQFWGLGTAMLMLSAWIFGYLFASPARNLFQKGQEPSSPAAAAMISLAGPAVSLALGMVSLLLVPLGGMAAFAGRTLFSMNFMYGIYSLVPFDPMDGKPIFDWNRSVWAAIFFPLLAVYAAIYLL